ncbi:2-amino-4-hydroxy-6-hydroxymethyldihydropteridine pyrophosphokinase [Novipirellula galeiformis]|uniref:2-amino-4-hydroxy-6-hydroxymethyldihydropteridine pyrophosphokinase n=1 Tax=Novipirellula galeiformis TaxID=2528004 RepID=A0A5C6CJT9_9BACT|nr:2-amino-4-hydroxy-6-hydroxymethyldihydropteridine diphosphokinase [Novipirellula galeiformis]TWU23857.1 2-amino-4-hydroxy-6-hydroxymethyldihydropteridine pyrophosphokinase [Novipirellula galeiformis]
MSTSTAQDREGPQESRPHHSRSPRSQCLISFGSNLGDRDAVIAEAARKVVASPMVECFAASRLFETPSVGGPAGQEPFLNAVGAFETTCSARDILGFLQSIENELGRQRRRRWDARSIDLDVVLHGNLVGGGAALIVPHPRYTARQFVLQPACDVAAHYRDPRFGWTLGELSSHLSAGNASLALVGGDVAIRQLLCERLSAEHGIRTFAAAQPVQSGVALDAAMSGRWMRRPSAAAASGDPVASSKSPASSRGEPIVVKGDEPWVSAYVPKLPIGVRGQANGYSEAFSSDVSLPRLVARMQWAATDTQWPAPHQMWPAGGRWPEYRLEIDNLDWAVTEIASAIVSMRCPVRPLTPDGQWWR